MIYINQLYLNFNIIYLWVFKILLEREREREFKYLIIIILIFSLFSLLLNGIGENGVLFCLYFT